MDNAGDFIGAQSRADAVAQELGTQAPRPLDGESLKDYRIRLAGYYKEHSPEWKDINLKGLGDHAFGVAEGMIYKDALHVAKNPKNEPGMPLRARTKIDESGRRITEWFGDPLEGWKSFIGHGIRYVTGINKRPAGSRLAH